MSKRVIKIGKAGLTAPVMAILQEKFEKMVKDDSKAPITFVFRNCPGGAAVLVMDFITRIKASGVPVITHNRGKISSSAFILFLVGHRREGTPACEFHLHRFKITPREVRLDSIKDDFRSWERSIESLGEEVTNFIVDNTSLPREEVIRYFSEDQSFLTCEQAMKCGVLKLDKIEQSI